MNIRTIATIVLCMWLAACGGTSTPTPSDAKTMSCGEFAKLDQPARVAAVKELVATKTAHAGPQDAELLEPMAAEMCKSMPDRKVGELVIGPSPPSQNPPSTR
jgi:hypothetical protein